MTIPSLGPPPVVIGCFRHLSFSRFSAASTCEVHAEKILSFGRSHKCDWTFDDPFISNQHLQVYCIRFDENVQEVRPLVYAKDASSNGSYWNGTLIGKQSSGVLLSDGDLIRLSPRVSLVYNDFYQYEQEHLKSHQKKESEYFRDRYRISNRLIGTGANAKVLMAQSLSRGYQLACKILDLEGFSRREHGFEINQFNGDKYGGSDSELLPVKRCRVATSKWKSPAKVSRFAREFEILKDLRHPNIIRLEKVLITERTFFIFEELVTGGDLFSYIMFRGGSLEEAEAGVIVKQLLEAVNYLHGRNIVHRDIKPENILIGSLTEAARIVLTDFGSATRTAGSTETTVLRMWTLTGTPGYSAPEITNMNRQVKGGGYTGAVDMWAVGCVTTALLTGSTPWEPCDDNEEKTASGPAGLVRSDIVVDPFENSSQWKEVSTRPRDFIGRLLLLDEKERMTAECALEHDWLANRHVKHAFDTAYDKAVSGWQNHSIQADVIEIIPESRLGAKMHEHQSRTATIKKRKLDVGSRNKGHKPIEPHYQPMHSCVSRINGR